ncbi:hypothetical protein GGH92_008077 [Coemansia sp. RSA 2673]|nr:hypothetical protein GGH92_008077 [Coemansia sp. RSA 2673]
MLVSTCGNTGYRVGNPRPPIVYGNPNSDIAREVTRARDSIRAPSGVAPQLLLVILPSTNIQVYQTVKNCAYTTLGIHTQCMQAKHVQRPNMQYCANLCLKINAKLGGSNQALPSAHLEQLLRRKPTLFLGCDVTHPAPGEQHKPSIASVVGSVDFVGLRYVATLIQLPSRQEMVDKLQEAIVRHLKLFFKGTKTKPQRIVFYRDGVSETQFAQVRDREIIEIQRACGSIENGYRPDITFLAVLRRHNTRFFPKDREGDRVGNCVPGTVVDRSVTVPGIASFYLFSHTAFQRTSRPTYYSVLHDDSNFSPDAIQQITYHLCCTYAVSTRSVSPVPPVCYARRVANRAQYQVVDMDFGSDSQEAKIISINPILDSDQDPYGTIAKYYARSPSCLLDPHTAVGVRVAETLRADIEILGESTVHTICLSTAHPAKFSEAVLKAVNENGHHLDFSSILPPPFVGLLDMPKRCLTCDNSADAVTQLICVEFPSV